MSNFTINWKETNIYNFAIAFNRIEKYNEYCKEWLKYYGIEVSITSKVNWNINDIPDLKDYNRIKNNINTLLEVLNSDATKLNISNSINQSFDYDKANELEIKLNEYLSVLTNMQFQTNITGLTTCSNDDLKLNLG